MLENLKKYSVILASNSPRRKELLSGLDIDYTVRIIKGIEETFPEELHDSRAIAEYIAAKKAEAYLPTLAANELLITADTSVWAGSKLYGKPADRAEAMEMLRTLSGCTHAVVTGVCIATATWQKSFSAVTEVTFDNLSDEEIAYYVDRYQPMDKAGAYGVQEWIGYIGVKSISGSYFNVMGLPVQRLYKELQQL